MMEIQDVYQRAMRFAARKHAEQNQVVPGTILPYAVHLSNVAMEILIAAPSSPEFDIRFAVQVALLHAVIEDTGTSSAELEVEFGGEIASAVQALSKSKDLPKELRMTDSLQRIKQHRKEVWAVKIADRITNLQPPPGHWALDKVREYHRQAILIAETLKGGNEFLEKRLAEMIDRYSVHCKY